MNRRSSPLLTTIAIGRAAFGGADCGGGYGTAGFCCELEDGVHPDWPERNFRTSWEGMRRPLAKWSASSSIEEVPWVKSARDMCVPPAFRISSG